MYIWQDVKVQLWRCSCGGAGEEVHSSSGQGHSVVIQRRGEREGQVFATVREG